MVTKYLNGKDFLKDNKQFLLKNKYETQLIIFDAEILEECTNLNYALKIEEDDKRLVAIKVEPYNLILYGDKTLLGELLIFIKNSGFEVPGIFCGTDIGNELMRIATKTYGEEFFLHLAMDFMICDEITEKSANTGDKPDSQDVTEIVDCLKSFYKECGLSDRPILEKVKATLDTFRIVKRDGKIAAMARIGRDVEGALRITTVYTRPEYRGLGLAKALTNELKNEIIESGKIATLNVDQTNPVTQHIYSSIGFKKLYSHGIYLIRN